MDAKIIMNLPINQIICGNSGELLYKFPLSSINLIITSPPYDNLRDYKGYSFNFKEIAQGLKNVLKLGGVIVWIVGDATVKGSETGTSFEQALYFKKIGFNLHDTMIYQKSGLTFPEVNRYYSCFEYMFIFSKGKPKTFNLIEDRRNKNAGKNTGVSYRQADGSLKRKTPKPIKDFSFRFNIWQYDMGYMKSTKDKIAYQHPAIFPEQLAIDHIKSWSNKNDVILDPMCGSGTTCVAAKKLGRRYIGIDISEEYCKISRERLK